MFYIYRSFSIAGWIAAAVFFAYLLGWYLVRGRVAPRSAPQPDEAPPAQQESTIANQTDAKHP